MSYVMTIAASLAFICMRNVYKSIIIADGEKAMWVVDEKLTFKGLTGNVVTELS